MTDMVHIFRRPQAGHQAFAHGFGYLEGEAGAVAGGKDAGYALSLIHI